MTATATAPRIDFADLVARTDLRGLLDGDLGPPKVIGGVPHWPCPFHSDGNPSLYLFDGGRRWRCWPCGLSGDVLDFLVRREGIDVAEAARMLDPSLGGTSKARTRPRPAPRPEPPAKIPAWHDPAWQAAVEALVAESEANLWSPAGRPALDWLRGRGLADPTIRRFRLGFVEADGWGSPFAWPDGKPRGLYRPRGVLIPWVAPGADYRPGPDGDGAPDGRRWVGANVRRLAAAVADPLAEGPKCQALSGSERGHLYPYPEILATQGTVSALIVEGEFDGLVGWQEAGHLSHVGTVGGSSQTPHRSALAALALCPWLLLGFDHDGPGVEAARAWRDRAPHKARRTLLPHGKDLNAFFTAGGDVRAWLAGELDRLGVRS